MNLEEAIQSVDMDDVIDKMNAYAYSRLNTYSMKNFNGKEPVDFVGDVILKALDGTRNWNSEKYTFEDFLFGSLKSEISNFFNTKRPVFIDDLPEISTKGENNLTEEKKQISNLLRQNGADDDELMIFECWIEDMTKPAEIADFIEKDVKTVYNVIKRLERRLSKIRNQVNNII